MTIDEMTEKQLMYAWVINQKRSRELSKERKDIEEEIYKRYEKKLNENK